MKKELQAQELQAKTSRTSLGGAFSEALELSLSLARSVRWLGAGSQECSTPLDFRGAVTLFQPLQIIDRLECGFHQRSKGRVFAA
jgi:hypothetical protein